MSGQDDEREAQGAPEAVAPPVDEVESPTAVAEPVVIDLRDGVDTVAAYEADQARRAELAARTRR